MPIVEIPQSTLIDILWTALVEILGENEAGSLKGLRERSSISLTELHQQLNTKFDHPCCNGIEQRIGQACFRIFVKRMGGDVGFFESTFKLLPFKRKVSTGLGLLAEIYQVNFKEAARFNEEDSGYKLMIGNPKGINRQYYGCDLIQGFLREYMSWAGSGKVYELNEIECRQNGHEVCIYQIGKVPLE